MTWPGEGLLIKLWETLAEKGVGDLLKPWQIQREAKAQLEARRLEIVALADAEREADEIRSGRRKLEDSRYALALSTPENGKRKERIEPRLEALPVVDLATASVVSDAIRREVNVAKAITYAETELRDDSQQASDEAVDTDWLFRWRDYAGSVSSEELQGLWGRLLAGEVKSPGSFSYRALELLRNLSVEEANRIERLSRFVITDFIARNQSDILKSEGVHFQELLDMQDLGIIAGVESLGLTRTLNSVVEDRFVLPLCSHGRVLLLRDDDPKKQVKIKVYVVTAIGKQILRLGKFSPHDGYLRAVGEELKKSGVSVAIADYRDETADKIRFFNEQGL